MSKRSTWTEAQRANEREKQNARRAVRVQADPDFWKKQHGRQFTPAAFGQVMGDFGNELPGNHGRSASPPIELAEGQELKAQTIKVNGDGTLNHRYDKSQTARQDPHFLPVPPEHAVTKTTTRLDADGRVGLQYITAKPGEAERFDAFKRATKDELEQYRGAALALDVPAPTETWKDYMSFYWWGDAHIGMLAHAAETGAHYDLKIAESELVECFRQLVWRTPPSRIGRLVEFGDFFHAETNAQVTPGHGNKLDVDGRAYKVQKCGMRVLRSVIDLMKQRHEIVEFVALPGNHDPNMAFQIAAWLQALYEGDPRVVIDESIAPYNFREFGRNLIGTCHGDGAKENALPLLMATRQPEAWGRTRWHEFHAGHIHHTRKIEHSGCLTHYHNTLASKDAWHNHRGYDSEQFLESTTYHERFGPEGSTQVGIERVRAALAADPGAGP
jgi:hypothetical protein